MAGDGANRVSPMTRPSRGHGRIPPVAPISLSPRPRGEMLTGTVQVLVLVMSLLQGCAFLSKAQSPATSPAQTYERRCGPVSPMEPLDTDPHVVPDDRVALMKTQFSAA